MFSPDHCLANAITSCHSYSLLLPHHERRHDGESKRVSLFLPGYSATLPDPAALSTSSEGPPRVRPSCGSACLCNKSHVSKEAVESRERQHPGLHCTSHTLLCPALTPAINTSPSKVHQHMRGSTDFQESLFQAILERHSPTPPHSLHSMLPLLSMCVAE